MCHVLIIEDNPIIANGLADLAIEAGATSTNVAASPDEALVSALAHHPAVLFSDVQIIDGTGPEAANAIRHRLGLIPVIFITALPHACRNVSAAAVLLKPVARQQLFAVFEALMIDIDSRPFCTGNASPVRRGGLWPRR